MKNFIAGVLTAIGLYAVGNAIYDKGYDDALEDSSDKKENNKNKDSKKLTDKSKA